MLQVILDQARANIRDNPTSTATGIITTAFSLVILGTFILIYDNLINISEIVFEQSHYSVFLKSQATNEEITEIKAVISAIAAVEDFNEVTPQIAKKELIESFGEAGNILQLIDLPDFPGILEFTLSRNQLLKLSESQRIKNMAGVDELFFGKETKDQVATFFGIANFVGLFLTLLLIVSLYFIISNSVHIAIRLRIKQIEIFQNLGATRAFIRLPYVLEGMFIAATGYAISLAAIFFLYHFIIAGITFNEATYLIKPYMRFFTIGQIAFSLLAMLLMGVFSAFSATTKVLGDLENQG